MNSTVLYIMSTYWILPVHFNIGFFISPRTSLSIFKIFGVYWHLLCLISTLCTMVHHCVISKLLKPRSFLIGPHQSCTVFLILMHVRTSRSLQTVPPVHLTVPTLSLMFSHSIFIYLSVHLKIFIMVLKWFHVSNRHRYDTTTKFNNKRSIRCPTSL